MAKSTPVAMASPIGSAGPLSERRRSSAVDSPRNENMTTIPAAKPAIATPGRWCSTPGSSSIAAAANTTPAAKCWMPLVARRPGGRIAATAPETPAATTGIRENRTARRSTPER
jgi:hypothetical protein